jgi:hypothetical protein
MVPPVSPIADEDIEIISMTIIAARALTFTDV